jgi:hypothetical protein
MKTRIFMLALTLALAGSIATQVQAQTIISSAPIGVVGWTSRAADCRITSGAGLASLSTGNVTFKPAASGTISLECQTTAVMRVDPTAINAFGLTFRNDNGFVGGVDQCKLLTTIGSYPYAGGLPTLIGAFSTAGQTFSGVETANIPLTAFLDYNNNMYLIGISLTRVSGATCNPVAVASFLEDVIQ